MTYVRNPVYLGVGAVDQTDRDAGLVRRADFQKNYKKSFFILAQHSPEALARLQSRVQAFLARLPDTQRRSIQTLATTATHEVDPRAPTGLGLPDTLATAANAVHWTTQVANIAGVVASLATVGFGVANFIESRKSSKADQERQDKAQAMQQQQMNADLAERQARLDAAKAQTASAQQQRADEAKQQQIEAAGYMMTPDGKIIPKPKNTALTTGAIGAAIVGAFLMSK